MERTELIRMALDKLPDSYAPYSRFHVAAALLTAEGRVYLGCNIENAAYSPSVCAERTAFFKAVSEGERHFDTIVICGTPEINLSTESYLSERRITTFASPCGVCRQVMEEFCDPETFTIILARAVDDYKVYTLKELLPEGFGPSDLQ